MNKARFTCVLVAAMIVAASCSEGPLGMIGRSADDPLVVSPRVSSFIVENRIEVSWPADPCADEYVLELSSGGTAALYSIAYRGSDRSFVAEGCPDKELFLFRLTKIRGDKFFGPSVAVLGVGSSTKRDAYEPNDRETDATELDSKREANIYYFRACDGTVVSDDDWYAITIPPGMEARVVIKQENPSVTDGTETMLMLSSPSEIPEIIINNIEYPFENITDSQKTVKFRISPSVEDFLSGLGSEGGGTMATYSVEPYAFVKPSS